jgi:hypothetical protein
MGLYFFEFEFGKYKYILDMIFRQYIYLIFRYSTSWISCFATTRWSVITLDPGKKTNEQPLLLLVDTTIEGASSFHARQE